MRCNPSRWLWGLIPIAMLSWGTYYRERPHVEADLSVRAIEALRAAGQPWAKVTMTGRDAVITGRAQKDGEPKAALDVVRGTWGIRTVQLKTDLASVAAPPEGIGPRAAEADEKAKKAEALAEKKAAEETEAAREAEAQAVLKAKQDEEAAQALKAKEDAEAAAQQKAKEEAETAAALKAKEEAEAAARAKEEADAALKAKEDAEAAAASKAKEEADAAARAKADEEAATALKAKEDAEAAAALKAEQDAEVAAAQKAKEEAGAAAAAAQRAKEDAEVQAAQKAKQEADMAAEAKADAEAQAAAEKAAEEKAAAERAARKTTAETTVCEKRLADAAAEDVIFFSRASADIDPKSSIAIAKLAEIIKKCPGARVEVEGHTDSEGTDERNQNLSERRARAVVNSLAHAGVTKDRLSSVGYGASQPVAPNDTRAGMARNRRIEFKVFTD